MFEDWKAPITRPAVTPKPVLLAARTFEDAHSFAFKLGLQAALARWRWVSDAQHLRGMDQGMTMLVLPNAWRGTGFSELFTEAQVRQFHIYHIDEAKNYVR